MKQCRTLLFLLTFDVIKILRVSIKTNLNFVFSFFCFMFFFTMKIADKTRTSVCRHSAAYIESSATSPTDFFISCFVTYLCYHICDMLYGYICENKAMYSECWILMGSWKSPKLKFWVPIWNFFEECTFNPDFSHRKLEQASIPWVRNGSTEHKQ